MGGLEKERILIGKEEGNRKKKRIYEDCVCDYKRRKNKEERDEKERKNGFRRDERGLEKGRIKGMNKKQNGWDGLGRIKDGRTRKEGMNQEERRNGEWIPEEWRDCRKGE